MKRKQPIDCTRPLWNWRKDFGRFRIAYSDRFNWWLGGAWKHTWWFCLRNYPSYYIKNDELKRGEYCQLTILGLNIGYCYRKDFKK